MRLGLPVLSSATEVVPTWTLAVFFLQVFYFVSKCHIVSFTAVKSPIFPHLLNVSVSQAVASTP